MSDDPIEELFRKGSKESVSEKPRDLVWKRIETGLQNQEKKKKPLREFISSVWSSAAVFALIAIPYFILFVMNINADNQSLLNVVKTINPNIEDLRKSDEEMEIIEIPESDIQPSSSIVRNDEVEKSPQRIADEGIIQNNLENQNELNTNDRLIPDISLLRTQALDSIEKNDQLALNSKLRKFSSQDTIAAKQNAPVVIRGMSRLNESSQSENKEMAEQRLSNKVASNQQSPSINNLEVTPGLAVSTDKKVNNADNIIYKPLKFVAKTDIVRTSFRLEKKTNNKITFVNKTVTISFEKTADKIILRTNESKMNPNLINLLERNKKEIFTYYQK
ncbi:hypothetical protein SAMN05443634_11316 [Chishuiella changwenlii]|uniref:Uncharacterized protein n=1 Tax=Chishuiella changwenlii TaxID=1434701 RepID=A0A1M7CBE4_9FLAO|nr:hypothetical protein [Chishuiella changwenlii]GGF06557.1 hypothetical protein GCM10010984_24800 [Chishuiella changwenlii]SHL64456.1 hypothetical protein SAMN05443634_11316 [Chishuiella changwenlii]